jgi:hypothetical protein
MGLMAVGAVAREALTVQLTNEESLNLAIRPTLATN